MQKPRRTRQHSPGQGVRSRTYNSREPRRCSPGTSFRLHVSAVSREPTHADTDSRRINEEGLSALCYSSSVTTVGSGAEDAGTGAGGGVGRPSPTSSRAMCSDSARPRTCALSSTYRRPCSRGTRVAASSSLRQSRRWPRIDPETPVLLGQDVHEASGRTVGDSSCQPGLSPSDFRSLDNQRRRVRFPCTQRNRRVTAC